MKKTISITKPLLLILTFFLVLSCNKKKISLEDEKVKILELHNAQRGYHFKKDSIAFVNQLSENFISVNKGLIATPKRQETISRYNSYFSAVEFKKWDDVSKPVIRISDDGTMAYTVVDKLVMVSYEDEEGNNIEGKTHFAWTAIYRKYGEEWEVDCVTSTNKPIE